MSNTCNIFFANNTREFTNVVKNFYKTLEEKKS